MKKKIRALWLWLLMTLMVLFGMSGCGIELYAVEAEIPSIVQSAEETKTILMEETEAEILEEGYYTSKEDVSCYIHMFAHLPDNFITKKEAEALGWDNKAGNLWEVAPGKSIGGGRFGNYEELLPDADGRKYYECDIDYDGGYRNEKRIVYSNDGLIFYTEDHYESFEQLY